MKRVYQINKIRNRKENIATDTEEIQKSLEHILKTCKN